jgi:hypothetical protein
LWGFSFSGNFLAINGSFWQFLAKIWQFSGNGFAGDFILFRTRLPENCQTRPPVLNIMAGAHGECTIRPATGIPQVRGHNLPCGIIKRLRGAGIESRVLSMRRNEGGLKCS